MRIKHSITLSLCTALLACAILTSCDEKEEGGGANGGGSAKKVDNNAVVFLGVNEDNLYAYVKASCKDGGGEIAKKYNVCTKFDNAVKQKVYDDSVKQVVFKNYKQEVNSSYIGDTSVFNLKNYDVSAAPITLYSCDMEKIYEVEGNEKRKKFYWNHRDCNSLNKEYTFEEQVNVRMQGFAVPIENKATIAETLFKDKYILLDNNEFFETFFYSVRLWHIIFPDQNSAMNFKHKENNKVSAILKKFVLFLSEEGGLSAYELYEYIGPATEKASEPAANKQQAAAEQPAASTAPAVNTATDYSSALQTHYSKGTLGATGKTRPIEMFFQSVSKNGDSYSIKGKSKTKAAEDAFNGSLSISSETTGGSCGGGEKEIKGTYDLNENESKTSGHFVGDFTACENNGKLSKANFVGNWVKHSNGNKTPCEFEL